MEKLNHEIIEALEKIGKTKNLSSSGMRAFPDLLLICAYRIL
jgi:hypothetical protein